MKSNKLPALTSPWKIGFFVSLLMLAMSIGVGFFITRAFNLSWTWIEFTGGSWSSWAFHTEDFIRQMAPLVLLVSILSLLSSMMISGAVRKYKAYLDSGTDYKLLLQSVKRIEDLNDEQNIKKLSGHPELRDFLMKTKKRVQERERALQEKEKDLASSGAKNAGKELAAEAGVLVSAIMSGYEGGFNEELALSNRELKRVEEAIKKHLVLNQPAPALADSGSNGSATLDHLYSEINETAAMLDSDTSDICADLEDSYELARDIEGLLSEAGANGGNSSAAGGFEQEGEVLSALDEAARDIGVLGEEAKAVAINTALHASQQAAVDSSTLVSLAEDVRSIATRFSMAAAQCSHAGTLMREVLSSSSPSTGGGGAEAHARMTEWLGKCSNLADKLKSLRSQQSQMLSELSSQSTAADAGSYQEVSTLDLEGVGDYARQVDLDSPTPAKAAVAEKPQAQTSPQAAAPAALDVERNLFADIPATAAPAAAPDVPPAASPESESDDGVNSSEMFEEMQAAAPPRPAAQPARPQLDETAHIDVDPAVLEEEVVSTAEESDFVQDPVKSAAANQVAAEVPAAAPAVETQLSGEQVAEISLDDDAVDLYELGAVDYQPESVHHNV